MVSNTIIKSQVKDASFEEVSAEVRDVNQDWPELIGANEDVANEAEDWPSLIGAGEDVIDSAEKFRSRDSALNALEEGETDLVIHEQAYDPLVDMAVTELVELDDRGTGTDIELNGKPYDVLSDMISQLDRIGMSYNARRQVIEAFEQFCLHEGINFSNKVDAKPLFAKILVTDKPPAELPELSQYQMMFLDGERRHGSNAQEMAMGLSIHGTTSTKSKPMGMDEMFEKSKKKGVFILFGSSEGSDLNAFDSVDASLNNLLQAFVGDAGTVKKLEEMVVKNELAPEAIELIEAMADYKNILTEMQTPGAVENAEVQLAELESVIAESIEVCIENELLPAEVAVAIANHFETMKNDAVPSTEIVIENDNDAVLESEILVEAPEAAAPAELEQALPEQPVVSEAEIVEITQDVEVQPETPSFETVEMVAETPVVAEVGQVQPTRPEMQEIAAEVSGAEAELVVAEADPVAHEAKPIVAENRLQENEAKADVAEIAPVEMESAVPTAEAAAEILKILDVVNEQMKQGNIESLPPEMKALVDVAAEMKALSENEGAAAAIDKITKALNGEIKTDALQSLQSAVKLLADPVVVQTLVQSLPQSAQAALTDVLKNQPLLTQIDRVLTAQLDQHKQMASVLDQMKPLQDMKDPAMAQELAKIAEKFQAEGMSEKVMADLNRLSAKVPAELAQVIVPQVKTLTNAVAEVKRDVAAIAPVLPSAVQPVLKAAESSPDALKPQIDAMKPSENNATEVVKDATKEEPGAKDVVVKDIEVAKPDAVTRDQAAELLKGVQELKGVTDPALKNQIAELSKNLANASPAEITKQLSDIVKALPAEAVKTLAGEHKEIAGLVSAAKDPILTTDNASVVATDVSKPVIATQEQATELLKGMQELKGVADTALQNGLSKEVSEELSAIIQKPPPDISKTIEVQPKTDIPALVKEAVTTADKNVVVDEVQKTGQQSNTEVKDNAALNPYKTDIEGRDTKALENLNAPLESMKQTAEQVSTDVKIVKENPLETKNSLSQPTEKAQTPVLEVKADVNSRIIPVNEVQKDSKVVPVESRNTQQTPLMSKETPNTRNRESLRVEDRAIKGEIRPEVSDRPAKSAEIVVSKLNVNDNKSTQLKSDPISEKEKNYVQENIVKSPDVLVVSKKEIESHVDQKQKAEENEILKTEAGQSVKPEKPLDEEKKAKVEELRGKCPPGCQGEMGCCTVFNEEAVNKASAKIAEVKLSLPLKKESPDSEKSKTEKALNPLRGKCPPGCQGEMGCCTVFNEEAVNKASAKIAEVKLSLPLKKESPGSEKSKDEEKKAKVEELRGKCPPGCQGEMGCCTVFNEEAVNKASAKIAEVKLSLPLKKESPDSEKSKTEKALNPLRGKCPPGCQGEMGCCTVFNEEAVNKASAKIAEVKLSLPLKKGSVVTEPSYVMSVAA